MIARDILLDCASPIADLRNSRLIVIRLNDSQVVHVLYCLKGQMNQVRATWERVFPQVDKSIYYNRPSYREVDVQDARKTVTHERVEHIAPVATVENFPQELSKVGMIVSNDIFRPHQTPSLTYEVCRLSLTNRMVLDPLVHGSRDAHHLCSIHDR